MKFGLFFFAENPAEFRTPDTENYQQVLELTELAEDLGFDQVWTAEHHFDAQYPPNPFILCAAMAARTSRIRIGTNISILPLHHPLIIAENAAMVDVLSNGRFDLGLGIGYEKTEFDTLDVPRSERGRRMEEGLQSIIGLFTEENFTFKGRHFHFDGVTMLPRPVQKPHPPIWVAAEKRPVGDEIPPAIDRAARYGCHLTGPRDANMLGPYERALRKYGRDPGQYFRNVIRNCYVGETKEQAWRDYAPHALAQMRGYLPKYTEAGIFDSMAGEMFGMLPLPSAEELPDLAESGKVHFLGKPFMVGTPDDVCRAVEEDQALGATHILAWMQIGGMDARKTRSSMRLFAREVMPHFSG